MLEEMLRTLLISFLISVFIVPINILIFKKINYRQYIRQEGPSSHMKKSGTPTMGGISIIIALIVGILITSEVNYNLLFFVISILGFGIIGFIDDYIKVNMKRNLGFSAIQKLTGQLIISIIILAFYIRNNPNYSELIIPFTSRTLDMGILFIPFGILVILGLVNSTNLTDGLDGLASSITIIVASVLGIIIYKEFPLFDYNSSLYAFGIAGSLLGFLLYNKHPAKIFMGDIGSLALGGGLAYIFLINKLLLFIPILGGVYLIESLSVIIQVVSYKTRKKRIFLMSPIHHHFEELGWHEKSIVRFFTLITLALGLITYIGV